MYGREYTVQNVLDEVLPDLPFFRNSGGGVTLTGGEVLLQADFAGALLEALQEAGIHTVVETSGYGRRADLMRIAHNADMVFFDFKLWDDKEFQYYTNGDARVIHENLTALADMHRQIVLRVPLIHGVTDTQENIRALYDTARRYHIRRIDLLPYNQAAPEKYAWLQREYPLQGSLYDRQRIEEISRQAPKEIDVRIV